MTTTISGQPTAQIGDTDWYLVSIQSESGSCAHCGRDLKHLYRVVNPDGREITVGRGCVKKLTGWTLAAAEAKRILWLAERNARRAITWTEFASQHPSDAEIINADIAEYERTMPRHVGAGRAHEIKDNISDGRYGEWQDEVVVDYMRRRVDWRWAK